MGQVARNPFLLRLEFFVRRPFGFGIKTAREQDDGQHCSQEEKSDGNQKYPVGMQEAFLAYLERQGSAGEIQCSPSLQPTQV